MSSLSSSAPNRNTLNQRASRARRKTYVSDLERKVRDFEAHGVKATEEVQRAARRVADENRLLREQIHALRTRNAELEALLAAGSLAAAAGTHRSSLPYSYGQTSMASKETEQQYPSPPQIYEAAAMTTTTTTSTAVKPERDLTSAEILASASSYGTYPRFLGHHSSISSMTTPHDETSSFLGPVGVGRSGSRSASPPISDDGTVDMDMNEDDDDEQQHLPSGAATPHRHEFKAASYASFSQTASTTTTPNPSHGRGGHDHNANAGASWSNSTSCAQAAMIIASMRGLPSTDECIASEILSELGCQPATGGGGDGGVSNGNATGTGRNVNGNKTLLYPKDTDAGTKPSLASDCSKHCAQQDLQNCHVDNSRLFGILDRERGFT
ncbi:hypothetical protein PV08_05005 [Exophiala spinifera]|uniref:BZIP domain-containing protein n=1 Tax=Exophiala spinifera TaxID=91928 RepID=A0A0D2BGQ3_9EURO|nr:uncharacterized protein PV08_05005 [Exophiala spinifera]KIW17810.1 hypothetical protein PV08_05005 [Exophiala spinifera]